MIAFTTKLTRMECPVGFFGHLTLCHARNTYTVPPASFLDIINIRVPFIGSYLGDEDLQILPIIGKFLVELG
jgi:hypothetical protein